MLVDPELLRALASQADAASASIRTADVGTKATTAADGLPGSTTQWAMRLVGQQLSEQAATVATDVTKMATSVRGAGDRYEVEDNSLARSFDGLF